MNDNSGTWITANEPVFNLDEILEKLEELKTHKPIETIKISPGFYYRLQSMLKPISQPTEIETPSFIGIPFEIDNSVRNYEIIYKE